MCFDSVRVVCVSSSYYHMSVHHTCAYHCVSLLQISRVQHTVCFFFSCMLCKLFVFLLHTISCMFTMHVHVTVCLNSCVQHTVCFFFSCMLCKLCVFLLQLCVPQVHVTGSAAPHYLTPLVTSFRLRISIVFNLSSIFNNSHWIQCIHSIARMPQVAPQLRGNFGNIPLQVPLTPQSLTRSSRKCCRSVIHILPALPQNASAAFMLPGTRGKKTDRCNSPSQGDRLIHPLLLCKLFRRMK